MQMPTEIPARAIPTMTNGVKRIRRLEPSRRPPRRDASGSHAGRTLGPTIERRSAKRDSASNAAMLQERARIARELHDGVSQTLYAIALATSRALTLLQQRDDKQAQHIINDVLRLTNTGQSELRALLTDMRSDRLTSRGLTAALARLAADMRRSNGADIRLSLGDEPDLPADTKEALLLITREALHNVVRHSNADRVDIVLEVEGGAIMLLIADNGRGFQPGASRPATSGCNPCASGRRWSEAR
jgi:signal transduction histidine kinase